MQAFPDGGVRLAVAPVAGLGRLALYEPRRRTVTVAAEATRMAPGNLAPLLAHEATHVQDLVSGRQAAEVPALGRVEACYVEELRASLIELEIWRTLHPPDGKPIPEYDYEDWLNVELAAYQRNPDTYPEDVREWYAEYPVPASHPRSSYLSIPYAHERCGGLLQYSLPGPLRVWPGPIAAHLVVLMTIIIVACSANGP